MSKNICIIRVTKLVKNKLSKKVGGNGLDALMGEHMVLIVDCEVPPAAFQERRMCHMVSVKCDCYWKPTEK